MRITETITYHAAPDTVYAMTTDPAFQERKCVDSGALRHEVSVMPAGDGLRVVTTRDLPTDGLPDFVSSIVGDSLTVREIYLWSADLGNGHREGDLVVEAVGAPVALHGTVTLRADGDDTQLVIDGNLKASIPLLGGRIEKAAAPAFLSAIRSEHQTGDRWLAGEV